MTIVVAPIADVVDKNSESTTINLVSNFDDPFTTGLVARFELFNALPGGSVTNVVLFDQAGEGAPLTVQNFRNYVNEGDYPCRSNLELHPSLQCEFELLEHYCCIITATTNGKMASTTK